MLGYPKLAKIVADAQQLADLVEASSVLALPPRVLAVVRDETDNRVLRLPLRRLSAGSPRTLRMTDAVFAARDMDRQVAVL